MTYADGCVYEGMFHKDVRHGVGTLYSPNGSIFVGTYEQDKRQGLGVTYWAGRCKKYVAEYVDDMATCGAMMDIDEESVEAPATQQLRDAIAAARVRAAGAAAAAAVADGSCAAPVAELPELKLIQPSKVSSRVGNVGSSGAQLEHACRQLRSGNGTGTAAVCKQQATRSIPAVACP